MIRFLDYCCVLRREKVEELIDMTHITIRLASPPAGTRSVREIIRIKTPEKMYGLGESVLVETEEKDLNNLDICDETTKPRLVYGNSQTLRAVGDFCANGEENGAPGSANGRTETEDLNRLATLKSAENKSDRDEIALKNGRIEGTDLQARCESCGRPVERDEFESELYITRKDLASVQSQLETFKSRLEEELIERFKLEEELKSESEVHENEMKILKEKIASLEENECEKARRVEELESTILVYKEEHEKEWEEVENLRNFVGKYQSEICKLRTEANIANDQAVEAINEMEILTKKTERSEHEKGKIRQQLKSEMEGYWREVGELRNALENWEKLDSDKKNRIQILENEVASYKDLVNELREDLSERKHKTNGKGSQMESSKDEHLLVLCHELNEIFREHLNSQGKFSELSFVLTATQKELEEARNRSQVQNIALQEFKQKYNDLHDSMVALTEENRHLRNSLEKKCADFRDIRRKFLVSETEVSWLKEALNIVDEAKKTSLCTSVMETAS